MKQNLTYKIIQEHLIQGELLAGSEVAIKIDQTLTQDSTGTMVYLQLEAMNIDDIKTESVAYIDHNMIQSGFENADDHEFIKSAAAKYGITYSKPGGGICHQVHLERFGKPGHTLIGSDSHTPTNGGLGSLAIGAGGLDVAVAMARGYYYLTLPKVFNIELVGSLQDGVNGKDVILYVLQKLTVKGGVNYIMEYTGEGIKNLSVTDRATICNMGAELGATTSIFPSDNITREFLKAHNREKDFIQLDADEKAKYDEHLLVNLSEIEPMAAKPHSPDTVDNIESMEKIKIDQVAIGSCTNSSYSDMMKVAQILKGNTVHPDVSLVVSPGSSNILQELSKNGALADIISSGARILESSCGPCIGMGQSPKSAGVSLRTFNRNFKGRSGTMDAEVYLVSPETAAVSAIKGYLTNPKDLNLNFDFQFPTKYTHVDSYFVYPEPNKENRPKDLIMGPNIKPFPLNEVLEDGFEKKVVLKVKDNITTDDIVPSNASLLPFRSNIPYLSSFSFKTIVDDFKERCENNKGGIIIGGENYGQGSSREHAALVPLYLGIKAVIVKSFARIHKANLINSGILPLEFKNKDDYEKIHQEDVLVFSNLIENIDSKEDFKIYNKTKNEYIEVKLNVSNRNRQILLKGGYLNYSKNEG